MINKISKPWLGFTLGLIAYYFSVVWFSGFFSNPHHFLHEIAHDSIDYNSVADWIYRSGEPLWVARRAVFYPLVMGLAREWGGDWAIWGLQATLWLATALVFALSLPRQSLQRWGGLILFLASWTPILLTLVILTESLARFLFALVTLALVRKAQPWPLTLCILGILSVTKPNYTPIFGVTILILSLALYRRRLPLSGRQLFSWTALACLPLLIQTGLVHFSDAPSANNQVAQYVLQQYYYPQVKARVSGHDLQLERAETEVNPSSTGEILSFLFQHPGAAVSCIFKNLEENVRQVFYIDRAPHPVQNFWRKTLNSGVYWLHLLFLPLTLIALWRTRGWRNAGELELWVLALIFALGILPTGLTYWAADRLSATVLPVWPILYLKVATRIRQ